MTLHNNLTLSKIDNDPQLVKESISPFASIAAATLLMPPLPLRASRPREAEPVLSLVEQRSRRTCGRVDYLRVISRMHAKEYDQAAEVLSRLLNPESPGYHPKVRNHVLFDAWTWRQAPSATRRRLGFSELNKPGRRIEAFDAVERKLALTPLTRPRRSTRRSCTRSFRKASSSRRWEHPAHRPRISPTSTSSNSAWRWSTTPTRIVASAAWAISAWPGRLADHAPGISQARRQVYGKHGDEANAKNSLEMAKQVGLAVGPQPRPRPVEQVSRRSPQARRPGRSVRRYDNGDRQRVRQYQEDRGPAALETYRKLADLHGKLAKTTGENKEVLNALLMTANGLALAARPFAVMRRALSTSLLAPVVLASLP